ncbi:MAG: hypothetical protein ABR551_08370 [Gemmatimonadales bacterium]
MGTLSREQLGGWSMIAGAVMSLVTMAFHPTGGDQPLLSLAVHALATCGVPIAVYGAWVLTRHLAVGGPLSELALAFYAMAGAAALAAATASGFLAADLIAQMEAATGDIQAAARAVLHYNTDVNQAYARILVAATAASIGIWSVEILRTGLLRRSAGVLGCLFAVVALTALLSGRLTLDVHGFGAVVLGQGMWLVLVGWELRGVRTGAA